ncbi:hypothetical protein LINGRAHAP2_LOCUS34399, partial [Linum grandiflorum]
MRIQVEPWVKTLGYSHLSLKLPLRHFVEHLA